MTLYDPSLALEVEETDVSPFAASPFAVEKQRELVAEPVRHGINAQIHPRAEARRLLEQHMNKALRRLLGSYHGTRTGGADPRNVREPNNDEAIEARRRFAADRELHGLAFTVARLRGYERWLDALDQRDGLTTRLPSAGSAIQAGDQPNALFWPFSVPPAGLR